jgi:hypothetical protein
MAKTKNNKLQNTGILFELLVRQIASDVMSGKDSPAVDIVKKYFSKSELSKEYKLYQTLVNSKTLNESKAESLINITIDLGTRLSKSNLRKEKYNLIKEIKEHYDLEEFFKAKINHYKEYAAIYNLLESKNTKEFIDPQIIVTNKLTLLEHISKDAINKENMEDKIMEEYMHMDKGTRLLVYRLLLEKFNSKYSNLTSEQKIVLKEFINNISDTVKLKTFINEQYMKVKKELLLLQPRVTDKVTKIKLNEIINLIQPAKTNTIKDDDIVVLLQYHQLISDLKSAK